MISSRRFNERRRSGLVSSGPAVSLWAAPSRLDSLVFLALMSGPPKFRARDLNASLAGQVDVVALIQIVVWACAALWVVARLYPSVLRRGAVPPVNPVQVIGAFLVVSLSLSLADSPGFLLSVYTLGQLAVMLSFAWVFAHRFGPSTYLRHLFIGVCLLMLTIAAATFFVPELAFVAGSNRIRGDFITPTGPVAVMGLVFCLSNTPAFRSRMFWGALLFFGVLLAASQTRTAYVAFLVYLAIGYIRGKGLRVRKLIPLLLAASVILWFLEAFSSAGNYLLRETTSLETMSDRIPLWEYLTKAVMREAPLTGLGYYAASRVLAPKYNSLLGTAHSMIFEILVGGGLVGLAVFLLLCASLLWYAGRLLGAETGRAEVVTVSGLLAVTLVQAITGSDAMNAGPIGFTFWSLTALLPMMWRQSVSRGGLGIRHRVVPRAGLAPRPYLAATAR